MSRIRNKQESIKFIKDKNLNSFGEQIFKKNDIKAVTDFLKQYDCKYYYMRELIRSTENVFYDLNKEQVLNNISKFKYFGLAISSKNYIDNQILCAEICIGKDNSFTFSGSTNNKSTHRNFLKPDYYFNTDIFDERIKYVPHIEEAIDYIYKHNLFDMVLELCVFDIPVGIKNEKVIIYEARTDY